MAPRNRFKCVNSNEGEASLEGAIESQQAHTRDYSEDGYTGDEINVDTLEPSGTRKKRGITRMADVWNLPPEVKIPVIFNAVGQPLEGEGGIFERFIGSVGRTYTVIPINIHDWRKVPQHSKDQAWEIILSKFLLPNENLQEIKKRSMKSMGDKWKNWKCQLKAKNFDESKTPEYVMANAPKELVDLSQYADLVHYWYTTEGLERSKKAKESRAKQTNLHTAGSKSYARHAHDLEKKEGSTPSRAKVYIITHQHADNTPINDEAAENISKMQELIPQEQSNTQSVSSGSILWSPNDVYAQVIGPERRGRVRGLGFGPTPSSHPDSIKSNSNNTTAFHTTQDQQRISQLEDELSSVKNLVASLLQRLDGQCECSIPNQNSPNGRPRSSAASRQMPNQSHDNDDGAE